LPFDAEGLDGPFDVLKREASEVIERRLEATRHGLVGRSRYYNTAGRCLGFQPSGYIDTIAVKIVSLDNQITDVQTKAKYHRIVYRLVAVGVGGRLLELYRRRQRIDCAGELH
jgi:hypothetical protein